MASFSALADDKIVEFRRNNTDPDMERALEIAIANAPYVGRGGTHILNIAQAIAKGIALGRELERNLSST